MRMTIGMSRLHYLVVIQGGRIDSYVLDDLQEWHIGRPTPDNKPEIGLYAPTISREHGVIKNIDGTWFYMDHYGKNGTMHNGRPVVKGPRGRRRPIRLEEDEQFLFGSGGEYVFNENTVYAIFTTCPTAGLWRKECTSGYSRLTLSDGAHQIQFDRPAKGAILHQGNDMAIFMGDYTYLSGNLTIRGIW